jgi:hypothetical protein
VLLTSNPRVCFTKFLKIGSPGLEPDGPSFGGRRSQRRPRSLSRQVYTGYGPHSRLLISKIVDEFYSGYLYTHGCNGETVSSAEYVDGMSLIFYYRVSYIYRCQ